MHSKMQSLLLETFAARKNIKSAILHDLIAILTITTGARIHDDIIPRYLRTESTIILISDFLAINAKSKSQIGEAIYCDCVCLLETIKGIFLRKEIYKKFLSQSLALEYTYKYMLCKKAISFYYIIALFFYITHKYNIFKI